VMCGVCVCVGCVLGGGCAVCEMYGVCVMCGVCDVCVCVCVHLLVQKINIKRAEPSAFRIIRGIS